MPGEGDAPSYAGVAPVIGKCAVIIRICYIQGLDVTLDFIFFLGGGTGKCLVVKL